MWINPKTFYKRIALKMRKQILYIFTWLMVCNIGQPIFAQSQRIIDHSIQIKVFSADYSYANPSLNAGNQLFIPNGIEFGYTNTINERFSFAIPLKYHRANISESAGSHSVYSADVLAKYNLSKSLNKWRPYTLFGGGIIVEEEIGSYIQIPMGAGVHYMIGEHSLLSLEGQYRHGLEALRNNIQIGLGISFSIGKVSEGVQGVTNHTEDEKLPAPVLVSKEVEDEIVDSSDTDQDGIADADDDCPNLAGLEIHGGCPDTDKDGIKDSEDACPDKFGPISNDGCPIIDTDGDGIKDEFDDCPTEAGSLLLKGCPDTDGDGIPDSEDACPSIAGTNRGCPEEDTDGDGIPDSKDKCPTMVGDEAHLGCPEMDKEEKTMLRLAAENIHFQFGKAHLMTASYSTLDQIAGLLKKYPEFELEIIGHTDDVGRKVSNMELSYDRAISCRDYLISRSIEEERIKVIAEGELKPIQSNITEEGRTENRRVEFRIIGQ